MMTNKRILISLIGCLILIFSISGCKKNSYYVDTGLHKAQYDGTVMQYLENNPNHLFDSLVKVIKLAGMEDVFQKDSITFFAPADTCIKSSIEVLNYQLALRGKDTISDLAQLSPDFWRQQLSMYIFKGIHRLKDYPQIDPLAMQVYGGQYYSSYGGKVMNIGVLFNDVNGVKYAGYRQLLLGYFSGATPPSFLSYLIPVASSDINPKNGIVHVLQFTQKFFLLDSNGNLVSIQAPVFFGFYPFDFYSSAIEFGIDYSK